MSEGEVIAINYGQEFGWSGSLLAEICPPLAASTVLLSHNFDQGAEIGLYQAPLSEHDFRRALASLRRSRYDQLPVANQPYPPETCFIHVGERRYGEAMPATRAFPVAELPVEIAELRADFVENTISSVRRGPVRVLSVSAAWQKPTFDPREALAVDVTLLCKGVLPIAIGNPFAAERPWSGLSLALRNESAGPASIALDAMHLRAPSRAPDSDDVTLAVGQRLEVSIRKEAYLAPGVYDGMLVYRSIVSDGDPQAINGELWIPLGSVTIAASRSP